MFRGLAVAIFEEAPVEMVIVRDRVHFGQPLADVVGLVVTAGLDRANLDGVFADLGTLDPDGLADLRGPRAGPSPLGTRLSDV
jgi:hypothetical protein